MYIRRPGCLLNVLCTFSLRPVSTGIWQVVFYSEYLFCQGRQDTSFQFDWTRRKVANNNYWRQICKQAIIILLFAYSLRKIFFVGKNSKYVPFTYSFLELLIFFLLTLVGIFSWYRFHTTSKNCKNFQICTKHARLEQIFPWVFIFETFASDWVFFVTITKPWSNQIGETICQGLKWLCKLIETAWQKYY